MPTAASRRSSDPRIWGTRSISDLLSDKSRAQPASPLDAAIMEADNLTTLLHEPLFFRHLCERLERLITNGRFLPGMSREDGLALLDAMREHPTVFCTGERAVYEIMGKIITIEVGLHKGRFVSGLRTSNTHGYDGERVLRSIQEYRAGKISPHLLLERMRRLDAAHRHFGRAMEDLLWDVRYMGA